MTVESAGYTILQTRLNQAVLAKAKKKLGLVSHEFKHTVIIFCDSLSLFLLIGFIRAILFHYH